jgi:serine/threonine-protein kinase
MPRPEDMPFFGAVSKSETPIHRKKVGNYEILERLGKGGMGVVYKALDRRLERVVALKMLPTGAAEQAKRMLSYGATDERSTRFRREALAVAKLQHPHIVQIYDIGEQDGQAYIALEFVAGGSLAQKLRTEKVSPHYAGEIIVKLAQAVHHAHQSGVLHRDLKPSNVLLTPDGEPKIADFGLARVQELPNDDLARTHEGAILGTPTYMAPEQAAGKVDELGAPTDVYGLGTILYEMLTGRPPFRGENVYATLSRLATELVVPPRTINPAVSPELNAICLKCLEKKPLERYASAIALAEDLQRCLKGLPIQALPETSAGRLGRWWQRSLGGWLPFRKGTRH